MQGRTCSVWRGVGRQLQDVLQVADWTATWRLLHQNLLRSIRCNRLDLPHHRPWAVLQLKALPRNAPCYDSKLADFLFTQGEMGMSAAAAPGSASEHLLRPPQSAPPLFHALTPAPSSLTQPPSL